MYRTREQAIIRDGRGFRKGVCAVAKELGVTYTHLYLILAGKRKSERLLTRIKLSHPELLEI
jgi:hypothetical protein